MKIKKMKDQPTGPEECDTEHRCQSVQCDYGACQATNNLTAPAIILCSV